MDHMGEISLAATGATAQDRFHLKQLMATIVALLGILVLLLSSQATLNKILAGHNDFLMLYSAARLAWTPGLYNPKSMWQEHARARGVYVPALQYTRPPFYAALLWPLGRMPYHTALAVWQAASFAALICFVFVWNASSRLYAILACCWSLPLLVNFAAGQDSIFILLTIGVVLRLHKTRPFIAGLVMSFCAIKFHLFLLLPLLIIAKRDWKFGSGVAAAGAVLTFLSFFIAGASWPSAYLTTLRSPIIASGPRFMPNIHGLLAGVSFPMAAEFALCIIVAVLLWHITRRSSFDCGMAAVLVGGLLVSHHAYCQDCSILIPALLTILEQPARLPLRALSLALLLPLPYILVLAGRVQPLVIGLVALLLGMALLNPPSRGTEAALPA